MPFNWQDFLELAKDLQQKSAMGYFPEAAQRTAVSRAYYAVFCYLRDYAATNLGFAPQRSSRDHRLLREHLMGMGEGWAEIAEQLEDLRKWRNMCDYDATVNNLQELVALALDLAEDIFGQVR